MSQGKALLPPFAPDHAHRVHVEQQRSRSPLRRDFRVEHMCLPEAHIKALAAIRVLVQQITKIGRRLMRGGDGQEHFIPSAKATRL